MNKRTKAAERAREEIRLALTTVYAALNSGQQQKLLKDEAVKLIFDRYGVDYER